MGMPPDAELEVFTYEDFGTGVRWLAEQLVARDWIPDTILGVVRGGLFVSTALAYALDIKDVRHVNVEFYTDAGETLPEPVLIGQAPYLGGGKALRRILKANLSLRDSRHQRFDYFGSLHCDVDNLLFGHVEDNFPL